MGNVPGAFFAAGAYKIVKSNTFFSQKETKMKRKRNSTGGGPRKKQKVYKKKRVVKTRQKRKPVTKKTNIVKTVKRVLSQSKANGVYRKRLVGTLLAADTSAQRVVQDCYYGASTTSGMDFRFFTNPRLKDAASVLFNLKNKAVDYGISTNNFASEGFKMHVRYCKAKVIFKNNSRSVMEMVVVNCVSKRNSNSSNTAYQRYVDCLDDIVQVQPTDALVTQIGVEPAHLPAMHEYYTMHTVRFQLKPGQTRTFSASMYDKTFDWDRMTDNGVEPWFIKGISQELIVQYYPAVNVIADVRANSGRLAIDLFSNAISVEIHEDWSIDAPENTDDTQNHNQYGWLYQDTVVVGATAGYSQTTPALTELVGYV